MSSACLPRARRLSGRTVHVLRMSSACPLHVLCMSSARAPPVRAHPACPLHVLSPRAACPGAPCMSSACPLHVLSPRAACPGAPCMSSARAPSAGRTLHVLRMRARALSYVYCKLTQILTGLRRDRDSMFPDSYFVYWQHYIDLFKGIYSKFNSIKCIDENFLHFPVEGADPGSMLLQKDRAFYKDAVDFLVSATMHSRDLIAAQHPFGVISLGCEFMPSMYAFPSSCPALRVKNSKTKEAMSQEDDMTSAETGGSDVLCPNAVNFIEMCNQPLGFGLKTGTIRMNKISWHDKKGGDEGPQKVVFEEMVKKSLRPFLSSVPKHVSSSHRVLFDYPCHVCDNDVVEVTVRVEWGCNPSTAERVDDIKIKDSFPCIAEEMGRHFKEAGLFKSTQKHANAYIKEVGPDFFAFVVRLPLWSASPRNKNMRRDLLDHKSVIMICNITVDQSVEVLKFLLSIQCRPIPGGLFVTPVFDKFKGHDENGNIKLDGKAPCAVWVQYDSAETQEMAKMCIHVKMTSSSATDVLASIFAFSFGPANDHILPVTKRILGCPEHFRCNTAHQHNLWYCLFSKSPCTARLKGLIGGCSDRDHYVRNKGWVNFKESIHDILGRNVIFVHRQKVDNFLNDIAEVFVNVHQVQNSLAFERILSANAMEDFLGLESLHCQFLFGSLLYIGKLFAGVNPPQTGMSSNPAPVRSATVPLPPPFSPPGQIQPRDGVEAVLMDPLMVPFLGTSVSVPSPPPPSVPFTGPDRQMQPRNGLEGAHGKPLKRQRGFDWCCSHCGKYNDVDIDVVREHEAKCSFQPPRHLFSD